HHEQQASEHGDEQQHQELSPAYNRNLASPQASTQGLFQQVQAISLIDPGPSKEGGFERTRDFSPIAGNEPPRHQRWLRWQVPQADS
ncbi:MAG: hypothetical protein ABSF85_13005, partial [Terriglobales bacterium]